MHGRLREVATGCAGLAAWSVQQQQQQQQQRCLRLILVAT